MIVRAVAAMLTALGLVWPSPAFAGDGSYQETVYAVWVNGEAASDGTIVLQTADGSLAFSPADLQAWGVTIPKVAPLMVNGKPFYTLRSFPGATAHIDASAQRLNLNFPASLFESTDLNARVGPNNGELDHSVPGYYVNYDLHLETGTGSTSNLLLDAGTRLGEGVIDTSALAGQISAYGSLGEPTQNAAGHAASLGVERLQTQWRYDDVNNNTTLTIGDALTGQSAFADPVYFLGVGYGRNFSTEPWSSYVPLPSVSGTASAPSKLDVYVNNVLAFSQQVDVGPYRVTNLPNVNGLGQVQMVLRDAQGGQQVFSGTYYTSNLLLAKGVSDFSYDAGFVNYNYGQAGSYYGEFAATGSQRYGFSNALTGAAFAQFAAHDAVLGIGANSIVGKIGTLGLGVAGGASAQGGGAEVIADYNFSSPRFGFGLQGKIATANFQLAGALNDGFQRNLLGYASAQFGHRSFLGISYGQGYFSFYGNGYTVSPGTVTAPEYLRVATLTFHQGLWGQNYFQFLASHTGGSVNSNTINGSFVLQLSPSTQTSAFVQSVNGATSPGTTFTHSTSALGALDYSVAAVSGHNGYLAAQAQQYGAHAVADAAISLTPQGDAAGLDVAGAFIDVAGHRFITQPVQDAYGAVEVPGYPNVPVYVANEPYGSTDKTGYAALPTLTPYTDNTVSIDSEALPLSANVTQTSATTRAHYRLPVLVRFGAQNSGGVVLHVVDALGKSLIAGTMVHDSDGNEWPVANDGIVYVGGMRPGQVSLTAVAGHSSCRLSVNVPEKTGDIPDLGAVICK